MADYLAPTYRYFPAPQTRSACEVVQPLAGSINALRKTIDEQGVQMAALERSIREPAVKVHDLAIAYGKTANQLADHTRAINEQAEIINRQESAIRGLRHDGVVLASVILVAVCVVLGLLMLSAIFKRRSATRNRDLGAEEIAALDRMGRRV
jgi:hypothetical protein